VLDKTLLKDCRLLYLPNESTMIGWQRGPRVVFSELLANGEIEAYEAYSFEFEWKVTFQGNAKPVLDRITELVKSFGPTVILWQHPKDFPIPPGFVNGLRSKVGIPLIVYDERDPYSRDRPLPSGAAILAKESDVVSVVGFGSFADQQRINGAKTVIYSPHAADEELFKNPWIPPLHRDWDVVMIANLHGSFRRGNRILKDKTWAKRTPLWKFLPGNKSRLELAKHLDRAFGTRFALFGMGWDGHVRNKGLLPFHMQKAACRRAWASANWDQFDSTPYFFSDRLPIALLTGVAHCCHYRPGYEVMFDNGGNMLYGRSPEEIVDALKYLLSLPPKERIQMGDRGAEYARNHLTYSVVMPQLILNAMEAYSTSQNARSVVASGDEWDEPDDKWY